MASTVKTALYRWADHPEMPPRSHDHFVGYWTCMPRPLPAKAAAEAFAQFVRRNILVQVLDHS